MKLNDSLNEYRLSLFKHKRIIIYLILISVFQYAFILLLNIIWINFFNDQLFINEKHSLYNFLLGSIIFPIIEEVIFRKLLLEMFSINFNKYIAYFLQALVWSLLHFNKPILFITFIIFGVMFCFINNYTKTILSSIIIHISYNSLIMYCETYLPNYILDTAGYTLGIISLPIIIFSVLRIKKLSRKLLEN